MKFSKEFLEELPKDSVVSEEFVEQRRWYLIFRIVFKHEGKFYETLPNVPSTELQEDQDRYYADPVECPEVFPVEKTIIVYEKERAS